MLYLLVNPKPIWDKLLSYHSDTYCSVGLSLAVLAAL